jgi:hypothetical protein
MGAIMVTSRSSSIRRAASLARARNVSATSMTLIIVAASGVDYPSNDRGDLSL